MLATLLLQLLALEGVAWGPRTTCFRHLPAGEWLFVLLVLLVAILWRDFGGFAKFGGNAALAFDRP